MQTPAGKFIRIYVLTCLFNLVFCGLKEVTELKSFRNFGRSPYNIKRSLIKNPHHFGKNILSKRDIAEAIIHGAENVSQEVKSEAQEAELVNDSVDELKEENLGLKQELDSGPHESINALSEGEASEHPKSSNLDDTGGNRDKKSSTNESRRSYDKDSSTTGETVSRVDSEDERELVKNLRSLNVEETAGVGEEEPHGDLGGSTTVNTPKRPKPSRNGPFKRLKKWIAKKTRSQKAQPVNY